MGSLFRPTYTAKDPKTGERVTRKAKRWYGQYLDGDGVRRRVPLSANKAAAQQILADFERRAEHARAGISDPFHDSRRRPLAEHLADFGQDLRDKGGTADHAKLVLSRAMKLVEGCGFAFTSDITPSRVTGFLAELKREGLSAQTRNFYLQSIKQFCRWLVKDRRSADNSVAHLSAENVKLDRRHDRRALTDAELAALLAAARTPRRR